MTNRNITLASSARYPGDSWGRYGSYSLVLHDEGKWIGHTMVAIVDRDATGAEIQELLGFNLKPSNWGQGLAEVFMEKLREKFTTLSFETMETTAEDLIKRYDFPSSVRKRAAQAVYLESDEEATVQIFLEQLLNA